MAQFINPNTNEVVTAQEFSGDIVFERKTGNPTLDNEDVVNITDNNWKYLGIENAASPKEAIRGHKVNKYNGRGNNVKTHYSRQAYDYFELGGCNND